MSTAREVSGRVSGSMLARAVLVLALIVSALTAWSATRFCWASRSTRRLQDLCF